MEKNFSKSDEWQILRHAVSVYYKKINSEISSAIYQDVENSYKRILTLKQIRFKQRDKTASCVSVVFNSIYKRFFNIKELDEFFKRSKWQNHLSNEDLTRLILLLQRSLKIVKKDRGDVTYIEPRINNVLNEEFLSYNHIDGERGFNRCKKLATEELENKENFIEIFEKNLQIIYEKYRTTNLEQGKIERKCAKIEDFLSPIMAFLHTNSFTSVKKLSDFQSNSYANKFLNSEEIEEIGITIDGFPVYVVKKSDGTKCVKIGDNEASQDEIDEINFYEKEKEDNTFDLDKFLKNNSKPAEKQKEKYTQKEFEF